MKKIVIIAALVCGAWQQADAQYVSKVWVPDQKDGTILIRLFMRITLIRMFVPQVMIFT